MSTQRQLKKPEWTKEAGEWLSGDFVSAELKNSLLALLPSSWDQASKIQCIKVLDHHVQSAWTSRQTESIAAQTKVLREIEYAAHALLVALRKIDGDAKQNLDERIAYLAGIHGGNPPVTLTPKTAMLWDGDSALDGWWDVVQDVEDACAYTGSMMTASTGGRTTQEQARALVRAAAAAVYASKGEFPPSTKGTWFPSFAECLCKGFEIDYCGVELVNRVVKNFKQNTTFTN